jgi:glycosyltransferase involved in cell wall biosynthesis
MIRKSGDRMTTVLHLTASDMSLVLLLGPQLEAFRDAGYDVVTASAPGPYAEQLERRGFRHVPLRHATRALSPLTDVRAALELGRVLRTVGPDILHTHNPKPGVYGRVVGRVVRVPAVVNTVHGLYAVPEDRWLRRALVYGLERVAATCSDAELVQNPEDVEVLLRLGVPRRKVHLLGNGIDLDRFDPSLHPRADGSVLRRELGLDDDAIVVGAVGRLVREKGYGELFAAYRELRRQFPKLGLVVTGPLEPGKDDGLNPEEIRAADEDGVRFLGERDDVERIYSMLDIFVLASHREGFPRAAMEASAMGVPIVATDIRGCRQVVEHGTTGLLVPPRRADALAAAIAELVRDGGRRVRMGAAARAKAATDFDDRRVIATTLDVYSGVLARKRTAA